MSKYDRTFKTDILNSERAEDAEDDFDYDTYDDLDDDALDAKLRDEHGYTDEELDDAWSKWNSAYDAEDVDSDGNVDLEKLDLDEDGKADVTKTKPGKGNKKADELAQQELTSDVPDEQDNLDSTGTISESDDDDIEDRQQDINEALMSIKY